MHIFGTIGCGPVVLCDAGPKYPNHDNGKKGEEGFEERSVDFAMRAVTNVYTNDKVEDLANRK